MDLLGDYSSDEDDEGHHEKSSEEEKKTQAEKSVQMKRARKLLSLNAFLPPQILERLQREQHEENYADSSDEESPENGSNPVKQSGTRKVDMMSFLSELRSTKQSSTSEAHLTSPQSTESIRSKTSGIKEKKNDTVLTENRTTDDLHEIHEPTHQTRRHQIQTKSENDMNSRRTMRLSGLKPLDFLQSSSKLRTPIPIPPHNTQVSNFRSVVEEVETCSNSGTNQPNKKRSRKDIQRALREGKLDELNEDAVHVDQERHYYTPNTTVTDDSYEAIHMPTGGGSINGRQKSKNQINHLVASAVALQRARKQQQELGLGGMTVESRRTDSKRKYGW